MQNIRTHVLLESVTFVLVAEICHTEHDRQTFHVLCRTMACFERDLHTLISSRDHAVLAIYRSYL